MRIPSLFALILIVCTLSAGAGALITYSKKAPSMGDATVGAAPHAKRDADILARLDNYTRQTAIPDVATTGQLQPDVDTMIERLAARLRSSPNDLKGWKMLGWSYFQTSRYEEALTAFARALELDPNSAELKLSYEDAKLKASVSNSRVVFP